MEHRQNRRAQQTRERLRAAAYRLFLQQGYLATSIDVSSLRWLAYLCVLTRSSVMLS